MQTSNLLEEKREFREEEEEKREKQILKEYSEKKIYL